MCEEAPESKIQSVPWLLSVKLFIAAMKAAWSQVGAEAGAGGGADGAEVAWGYGSAGGATYPVE